MKAISCPHCQMQLEVEEEWEGQEVSCPGCHQSFVISIKPAIPQAWPTAVQSPNLTQKKFMNVLPQNMNGMSPQNGPSFVPQGNMNGYNPGYPQEPGFPNVAFSETNNGVSSNPGCQDRSRNFAILFSVISWFLLSNSGVIALLFLRHIAIYNTFMTIFLIAAIGTAVTALIRSIIIKFPVGIYIASALLATAGMQLVVLIIRMCLW